MIGAYVYNTVLPALFVRFLIDFCYVGGQIIDLFQYTDQLCDRTSMII